jgi:hypothetical protein
MSGYILMVHACLGGNPFYFIVKLIRYNFPGKGRRSIKKVS